MRLSPDILPAVNKAQKPLYNRAAVQTGVIHLGVGAFHRAHQAVVFDDALHAGDLRWGVRGASLRSADVANQLNPQDGLYTVVVRDGKEETARIVAAIAGVHVAPENPASLIEAMAHPSVHIVTLTITEKGYLIDPSSGHLLTDDPGVEHDLQRPGSPRTAVGFLCAALSLRRERGLAPFAALSCDNLPHNGIRTRNAVVAMANRQDQSLGEWIAALGRFPSTMVDRIVPATTTEDIKLVATRFGYEDRGLVKTEPFTQWVIENFEGPAPDFGALGVQLTGAVAPWEAAKLRLLNGSHSALAYLGALAGHEYVADAIRAPGFLHFIRKLMDEAASTLTLPPELNIGVYRAALLQRFANEALRHRTRQIAMDGSQKIPQRLLASVRSRIERGLPIDALALAVAGWIRWQVGRDESSAPYTVEDPLATKTAELVNTAGDAIAIVDRILTMSSVFGDDLPRIRLFRDGVAASLADLLSIGAAATVKAFADRRAA